MAPVQAVVAPPPSPSTTVFKNDIFKGKVLFCTGGGSGICKQMTEAIMMHGASAVIVGRKLERLKAAAEELSSKTKQVCVPLQGDVRHPDQIHEAVQKTIDQFGRIDFVINGAAGNFLAPIEGLSVNGLRTVIEIDTLGTYTVIKATLPHVRKTHGAYLHVSATLHYQGTPYQAHVSAAKAGVDALSNVLAVEEGPKGVRSNVIAPGFIGGTEGFDRLASTEGSLRDLPRKYTPLQRVGHPQDIANAAVFLFSDAANFITGQIMVVDGGAEHLRTSQLPYPSSVLDMEGTKAIIKGKL
ncbi:hypothetical protein FRC03_011392 [Tulasnella sp. 419]|nr:hypothetical protein FRC02_002753 [Tulasnella sp. 418]KAG8966751.1 hypothetical protein FRC03_011392 [Tulasnella sp. 419]